ncbi:ABC-three component system middle component 6 [Povalibacter sp.]|uniref:ABC-three component system middle component 6 n=1 Tax=Povalibacter sp. TaxID=1962978 RepID=UPI002F40A096
MILPAKHLKHDRALLGIGSRLLALLEDGYTVSELWERAQQSRGEHDNPISFDWFVLSLTFLFAIGAINLTYGVLTLRGQP